ncbi:MAG: ABC transporter permease [Aquihabitans sp.]
MLTIGRKALQLVVVFVVVTFFTVVLMSLVPGKPENVVVPFDNTPGQVIQKRFVSDNNLDRPLPVQWAKWAQRFVTGDLGQYYRPSSTETVTSRLGPSVSVSAALILYTMLLSLLVAIPLAVLAAYRSGGWIDKIVNMTAFGMISLPSFAAALLLSYYLGVKLNWLPTQGYVRPTEDLVGHLKSVAIPVIALSLGQIAVYMRLLRSDLVATLQEDFILMAKSKGVSNSRVLWRHALRPSSLTILTVAGLNVGTLIGGTVVIETLLGIPGVGFLLGEAVLARQYVALQSLVAVIAIVFVLLNFAVDALYSVLDPRIRERTA